MKIEIKIPALGESVSEATVSNIIAPAGSYVKLDQEILELETDKVNQVLYAPQAGQLSWNVQKDDAVKIGQVVGFIETDAKEEQKPKEELPKAEKAPEPSPQAPSSHNARQMPQAFVDSVREEQKPAASSLPTQHPSPKPSSDQTITRKKMSSLRKVIASRLVEAKNTTAMLTTFNEVDMSAIIDIRAKEKEHFAKKYGVKLGFMSFFVKASVAALKNYPQVNAAIDGDEILTYQSYDIGVAVSTERGLMVPVIKKCDKLSFGGIEKELESYSKKARDGSITVDDLRGGSFTITNGGVFGSLLSTPILNPPQSAILGMHSIVKRAVVIDDQIVIRPMMYVALSYDHRIVDGKEAVLFLVHIKQNLEDPSRLLLDL